MASGNIIKPVRGMRDLLPADVSVFQRLESACTELAASYGYSPIRFPIVESLDLFQRTIGQATDIVSKEMYTFLDGDNALALRPEGTAVAVRMAINESLLHNQKQRLWYMGPMFRHERPQKGRYRQFHQFGIEAFGFQHPAIDAEVIAMGHRLWEILGLSGEIQLTLNTLGDTASRVAYKEALQAYFSRYTNDLDSATQERLATNPLRVLDSKDPQVRRLIAEAPVLTDYLNHASQTAFETVLQYLSDLGVPYQPDPYLVRGLDYYNDTVFEWVTDTLGAQGTVCAGGRYDGLVAQLGGQDTPGVGFAMGLERLVLMMQAQAEVIYRDCDVFVVVLGEEAISSALGMSEALRTAIPGCRVKVSLDCAAMKRQLKRADQSGARFAVVIGESELAENRYTLKWLRASTAQRTLSQSELIAVLKEEENNGVRL